MDDSEYYAMMRRQYSNPIKIQKSTQKKETDQNKTPGTFSSWEKKYGHEDAEMFLERNLEAAEDEQQE
ncbi:hypothetical protein [Treponema sp.]|uniref:hypothetical protein n=1 Tax=Treponema sp. TaxID=166 RepID=UPI00298EBDF0|nr:hypothetical protein [Treponema sp.]MCQ2242063.1 hypothetical protein [Treponema sp.]